MLGVCGTLEKIFSLDVNIFRIIFIIWGLCCFSNAIIVYLILWFIFLIGRK